MDLTVPLAVVTPTLDAAVLQALAATTSLSSGAQVHRMGGVGSADGVRRVLARLVGQGIVVAQEHPHATLYLLNRDHVAAEAVVALTRLRQVIIDRITAEVAGWEPRLIHASLFGSFARGEADTESDVDILVIPARARRSRAGTVNATGSSGPAPTQSESALEAAIAQLAKDVYRWTGNRAHIVSATVEVVASMVSTRDPLVESWRADHVHLAGTRLLDVLRRVS